MLQGMLRFEPEERIGAANGTSCARIFMISIYMYMYIRIRIRIRKSMKCSIADLHLARPAHIP